jgi:hypothetical protein
VFGSIHVQVVHYHIVNLQYFQGDSINNSSHSIWENHGLSDAYMNDPMNYIGIYTQKFPVTYIYDDKNDPNNTNTKKNGNYNRTSTITFDKSPSCLNTELYPNIAERVKELFTKFKNYCKFMSSNPTYVFGIQSYCT